MQSRYLNIRSRIRIQFWDRFNYTKTKETHGDPKLLLDNLVNLAVPASAAPHRNFLKRLFDAAFDGREGPHYSRSN
jgi:hypothetical protein